MVGLAEGSLFFRPLFLTLSHKDKKVKTFFLKWKLSDNLCFVGSVLE